MHPEEYEDIEPERVCCFNCRYFEERNNFCRFNPPIPMNILVAGCSVTTSNFPRISMPNLDWCGKFEKFTE